MSNLTHWQDDIDEALGGDFDGSLSGLCIMSLSFDFTRQASGPLAALSSSNGPQLSLGPGQSHQVAASSSTGGLLSGGHSAAAAAAALTSVSQARSCGYAATTASTGQFQLASLSHEQQVNNASHNENSNNCFKRFKPSSSSLLQQNEIEESGDQSSKIVRQLQQLKHCLSSQQIAAGSGGLLSIGGVASGEGQLNNRAPGSRRQREDHEGDQSPSHFRRAPSVRSNATSCNEVNENEDDEQNIEEDEDDELSEPEESPSASPSSAAASSPAPSTSGARSLSPSSSISTSSRPNSRSSSRSQSPATSGLHNQNNHNHNNQNNDQQQSTRNNLQNMSTAHSNNHHQSTIRSANQNNTINSHEQSLVKAANDNQREQQQQLSLYSSMKDNLMNGSTLKESSYTTSVITTTAPMHFKSIHHPFSLKQFPLSPYHQFSNSSLHHDFYDRYLSQHDSHQPLQTPLIGIERTQDLLSLKLPPHGPSEDSRLPSKDQWPFEESSRQQAAAENNNNQLTANRDSLTDQPAAANNNSRLQSGDRKSSGRDSSESQSREQVAAGSRATGSERQPPTRGAKRKECEPEAEDGERQSRSRSLELPKGFPFNYKSSSSASCHKSADMDQSEPIDLNVSFGGDQDDENDDCCENANHQATSGSGSRKSSMFLESMRHFNPECREQPAGGSSGFSACGGGSSAATGGKRRGPNRNLTGSDRHSQSPSSRNNNNDDNEGDSGGQLHSMSHQYFGQESMFGVDPSKQKFRYVLAAPISVATKLCEDTMTYLNQGQAYEIKLENVTDVAEARKGFMCSIINIGFHERHMQQAENELWQQWSQQHPNEKIFSVDMKLSYNVFGVESDGLNKYEFLWDSSKAAGVFIRINSISTEFTPKKHGGEKGVPFKLSIETFSYNSKTHDSYFISAASSQIKVFKPKGAERKIRSDRDKISKRPAIEQDKYHQSCDHTNFKECTLASLHPMADGSLCYYRHSHGHFASKQIVSGQAQAAGGANSTDQQEVDMSNQAANNNQNSNLSPEHHSSGNQIRSNSNNGDSENNSNGNGDGTSRVLPIVSSHYIRGQLMEQGDNQVAVESHNFGQQSNQFNPLASNELFQQPTTTTTSNMSFNPIYHGNQVRAGIATLANMSGGNSQHFNMSTYYGHPSIHQANPAPHLQPPHPPPASSGSSSGNPSYGIPISSGQQAQGHGHFHVSPSTSQQHRGQQLASAKSHSLSQRQPEVAPRLIPSSYNSSPFKVNPNFPLTSQSNYSSYLINGPASDLQSGSFEPNHPHHNQLTQHDLKDNFGSSQEGNNSGYDSGQHHAFHNPAANQSNGGPLRHRSASMNTIPNGYCSNYTSGGSSSNNQSHHHQQQLPLGAGSGHLLNGSSNNQNNSGAYSSSLAPPADNTLTTTTSHWSHYSGNSSINANNNHNHSQLSSPHQVYLAPRVNSNSISHPEHNNHQSYSSNFVDCHNNNHNNNYDSDHQNSPLKSHSQASNSSSSCQSRFRTGNSSVTILAGHLFHSPLPFNSQEHPVAAHNPSLQVSLNSTCAEVVAWFVANRFGLFSKTFGNFSGSDLLRLTKNDLIEICGLIDGIRLYNSLHNQPIKPRRVLYVCHQNEDIFHPIYLHDLSLGELLGDLSSVFKSQLSALVSGEKSQKSIGCEKAASTTSGPLSNTDTSRSSVGAMSSELGQDELYGGAAQSAAASTGSGASAAVEQHYFNHLELDAQRAGGGGMLSRKCHSHMINPMNNNQLSAPFIQQQQSIASQQQSNTMIDRLLIDGLTSVKIVATEQVVQILENESVWTLSFSVSATSGLHSRLVEASLSACHSNNKRLAK